MVKIKGKPYRRVKMRKNGTCPSGATKHRRGKTRREGCYVPAKKHKRKGRRKKR